ncbi:MAG: phasin family protein [Pseudomonadota bacterium]
MPAQPVAVKERANAAKAAASEPQSLGLPLQVAVPAAVEMNSKLMDIAHSNVNAGLELARDLAGAKTPMEAMSLGLAHWFNHMGAVQAQARELQSLSAAWVKTASERIRTT